MGIYLLLKNFKETSGRLVGIAAWLLYPTRLFVLLTVIVSRIDYSPHNLVAALPEGIPYTSAFRMIIISLWGVTRQSTIIEYAILCMWQYEEDK